MKRKEKHLSPSQFNRFVKCEAKALAIEKGEYVQEATDAMLVGSYIDAYFTKSLDIFKLEHPEIFNSRTGELKAAFKGAEVIIKRIESDPKFMGYLDGAKQVPLEGYIAGVKFVGIADVIAPNRTVDMKILKDFEPVWDGTEKVPFWRASGYHIQGAIYQTLRAQAELGEIKPFYLAAATKQTGTDLEIFEMTEKTRDEAMETIRALAPRFMKIKQGRLKPKRCEQCEYCRSTKKVKKPIKF